MGQNETGYSGFQPRRSAQPRDRKCGDSTQLSGFERDITETVDGCVRTLEK